PYEVGQDGEQQRFGFAFWKGRDSMLDCGLRGRIEGAIQRQFVPRP
ncbi:MAG: hypothetical protein ACI8PQ_003270, partial [Planctomycetota bacterium]